MVSILNQNDNGLFGQQENPETLAEKLAATLDDEQLTELLDQLQARADSPALIEALNSRLRAKQASSSPNRKDVADPSATRAMDKGFVIDGLN